MERRHLDGKHRANDVIFFDNLNVGNQLFAFHAHCQQDAGVPTKSQLTYRDF